MRIFESGGVEDIFFVVMATDFATLQSLSQSLDDIDLDDDHARTPLEDDFHVLRTVRSVLRQHGMGLSLSLSRGEETQFVMPTATPIFSRLRYQTAATVGNFSNFDSDWKKFASKTMIYANEIVSA